MAGGLTTAGRNEVANLIIGSGVVYNSANARIGVGDSSTAFAIGQTDLVAASNKLRKIVDGAPSNSTNVLTFIATFGSSEANWAWNEWGIFNHASTGVMLVREVANNGTKVAGQTWVFTAQVTVGIGS
jgi:hypothetical protein